MPKILIVEDELMVADMVEEMLVEHGYEVCGIARTGAEAVALDRRHTPDLAVIDLRLADGEAGTEVAARLSKRSGLGILYTTGNMAQVLLTAVDGHACLAKPYHCAELLRSLEIVAGIAATGAAAAPFPRRFQVLGTAATTPGREPHG
jgi:DNA-binding response OmpR family regulator